MVVSPTSAKLEIPAIVVDGNDVEAVNTMTRDAIAQIRRTSRPYFIELQTYRQRGHREPDDQSDVHRAELDQWRTRDPIATMRDRLLNAGVLSSADIAAMRERALAEMQAALLVAQSSPWPSIAELTHDVYA